MKKILFAAFAATLLAAGCQKTEIIGLDNSQNGPAMTFSTEMKKITKTNEDGELTYPHPNAIGDLNLQAQGFNIWAYADYDIETATNVTRSNGIFDGMENWYVGHGEDGWSSNKNFYWPGKGKKLHFFAVSGSRKLSAEGANLLPSNYSVNNTPKFTINKISSPQDVTEMQMTIPNYQLSDNADDDLMVADFITQDQDSKGTGEDDVKGKISLNFRHTLSKVQFIFSTIDSPNAPEVYIQQLTVTNLKNKGTLVVKAKQGGTSTPSIVNGDDEVNVPITTQVEPKWNRDETQTGTKSFSVSASTELSLTGDIDYVQHTVTKNGQVVTEPEYPSTNGEILTENNTNPLITWLMMPQDLSTDSKIEVFYLIGNRQFKTVFPLAPEDATVTSWDENKFTKYNIVLAPNLITFSATSTPWDDAADVDHQN